jgi:hypothetical protein
MKLQDSKTGFYYVGTKRANITKLVSIYKCGYASGKFNPGNALFSFTASVFLSP